jgi:hypothetical protein
MLEVNRSQWDMESDEAQQQLQTWNRTTWMTVKQGSPTQVHRTDLGSAKMLALQTR